MKTLEEALAQPPAGKERYYADHGWGTDFIMDRQDGALSAVIVAERLNQLTAERDELLAACQRAVRGYHIILEMGLMPSKAYDPDTKAIIKVLEDAMGGKKVDIEALDLDAIRQAIDVAADQLTARLPPDKWPQWAAYFVETLEAADGGDVNMVGAIGWAIAERLRLGSW